MRLVHVALLMNIACVVYEAHSLIGASASRGLVLRIVLSSTFAGAMVMLWLVQAASTQKPRYYVKRRDGGGLN